MIVKVTKTEGCATTKLPTHNNMSSRAEFSVINDMFH